MQTSEAVPVACTARRTDDWTDGHCFEALLGQLPSPTGPYAEALRGAGYDVAAARPRYPSAVWGRCVAVVREHLLPGLGEAEGFRYLGGHFAAGFATTVLGRFVLRGLPGVGVEGAVQRLPRYWGMVRTALAAQALAVAERDWRLGVTDPHLPPDFMAGAAEHLLRTVDAGVQVSVVERGGGGYVLRIRW